MTKALYFLFIFSLLMISDFSRVQADPCKTLLGEIERLGLVQNDPGFKILKDSLKSWPKGGLRMTLSFGADDSAGVRRDRLIASLKKFPIVFHTFEIDKKNAFKVVKVKLEFSFWFMMGPVLKAIESAKVRIEKVELKEDPKPESDPLKDEVREFLKPFVGYMISNIHVSGKTIRIRAILLGHSNSYPLPKVFKSRAGDTYAIRVKIVGVQG